MDDNKVQIPGGQLLLSWFPEFYYQIINKEVVPDLHYDHLPSIDIYIYM